MVSKVYLIILSVLLTGAAGTAGYVGKQYVSEKEALGACKEETLAIQKELLNTRQDLTLCAESVEQQKEELAAGMTKSQSLSERLVRANREQEDTARQMTALQGRITAYHKEKSQSDAELEALESTLGSIRQLHHQASRRVEELKEKIAEFEEQERKYNALVASLKQEIHSREVTISQFQDRLNIRFVNRILFGNGRTEITPEGRQVLSQVGGVLKDLKENSIFVIGHTDDVPIGQELLPVFTSNWELSSARSAAVIRYLIDKAGVDPSLCVVVGRAYHSPLANNETDEGRSLNRRAEIVVAKTLEFSVP